MSKRAICRVWESSDSLNGNSCLLLFIQSTIPMISGDFLTRWNAITVGKGRGIEGKKGAILSYFIFLDRSPS